MEWKLILFAFVLAGAAALHAGDDPAPFPDTGPIRVREQFLIGMGYFAFDPASAEVLDRGKTRFDLVHSRTNTFARSSAVTELLESRAERAGVAASDLRELAASADGAAFLIDGELERTSIAMRRGLGRGFEASIILPVIQFGGGGLDGLIESFHSTFGFGQGGRTGARRDESMVYFRSASGREVSPDIRTGSAIGDIALALKKEITVGNDAWIISVEGVVELPTGSEQRLTSGGGVDLGTQILVTKNFDSACFHGAVGLVHAADSDVFGTDSQFLGTVMIGWEQMIGQRSSLVAQLTGSQSPFRTLDIEGLSDDAYLLNLGVKQQISSGAVAFVALSENLVHYDSSADIGFHVGVTLTR
ncbi:MAG: DUF3187 family protein [Acidobacteria bacterium]|nr:DUF3187 family protein [Acidobacteriota bacterium]